MIALNLLMPGSMVASYALSSSTCCDIDLPWDRRNDYDASSQSDPVRRFGVRCELGFTLC